MKDSYKTKKELIEELSVLKKQIKKLDKSESKLKLAESAVLESEENYRRLFETMAQGVVYQSSDGQIISANPAAERILGLSLDQMQGKTSLDPGWKSIREDGSELPGQEHPAMVALHTGKPVERFIMGVFNPKKAAHTWIYVSATPLFNPGEKTPFQVYTTFDDITERRRTEESLREKEEELRLIFDSITAAIFYKDKSGRHIMVNKKLADLTGIPQDLWIGKTINELLPKFADEYNRTDMEVINTGQPQIGIEEKFENPEGAGWVLTNKIPYKDSKGNVIGLIGMSIDITERKQAEEKLKKSLELEELILASVPHGLFGVENREIFFANDAIKNVCGWEPEELIGKSSRMLFRNDQEWKEYGSMLYGMLENESVISFEFPMPVIRKDGREIYCRTSAARIGGDLTAGNRIVAMIEDITDRKRAEEAIRESELKYRSLIECSSDAIFCVDGKGEYKFTNHLFSSTFGKTPDYFIGKTFWDVYPKEHADYRYETTKRVFQTGKSESIEVEVPLVPCNIISFVF